MKKYKISVLYDNGLTREYGPFKANDKVLSLAKEAVETSFHKGLNANLDVRSGNTHSFIKLSKACDVQFIELAEGEQS